jgi:hypothetical protein
VVATTQARVAAVAFAAAFSFTFIDGFVWAETGATGAVTSLPKAARREFNFFPIVGGDSDVGFGGGQVSDWAELGANGEGYAWKVEDAAFVTFKFRDGTPIVPYLDLYLLWTVPHFGPAGRCRLAVRPSFTDERNLGYYGIGNAAPYPASLPMHALEYRRIHPTLAGTFRIEAFDGFFINAGNSLTVSWLDVADDSLLSRDVKQGSPEVRRLLGKVESSAVELLELAVEYDTRDNELVTHRGQYHTLLARFSPAFASFMPYHYAQLNSTFRGYFTPFVPWLSISVRLVWDAQLGNPPFYELARFDDTPAIGGGKAIRGVPAQRYHGKVKLFGNLEVRSEPWSFRITGKPLSLGLAAFFDGGRTWTELSQAHPELDGTGLGLKYGIGMGLRLQEGRTFVVRADVAWSPDARPIGVYFDAGELF